VITRFNCISKTQQIHDLIKIKSIFTDAVISSNIPLGFMSEFIFSIDQSEMSLVSFYLHYFFSGDTLEHLSNMTLGSYQVTFHSFSNVQSHARQLKYIHIGSIQTGICARLESVRCYQNWNILLIVLRENIFKKCILTKEKRKRYEISVNLNDPGSVSDNPGYYLPLTTSNLANGMSATTFI
jgi:hypothetical protein